MESLRLPITQKHLLFLQQQQQIKEKEKKRDFHTPLSSLLIKKITNLFMIMSFTQNVATPTNFLNCCQNIFCFQLLCSEMVTNALQEENTPTSLDI